MVPLAAMDPAWLAALAAALLTTGVVAGLIAGLLGIGGGIVVVPVLYHLFTLLGIDESVRMHMAVGTSLATIVATATSSTRAHWRYGNLDSALLRGMAPGVVLGVGLGTVASAWVSGPALSVLFGGFAVLLAANMGLRRLPLVLGPRLPMGLPRLGCGALVGGLSTLLGIGGGTLSIPLLTGFGVSMRRAAGTAAGIGLLISIPGSIGFVITGLGVADRPPGSLGYVHLAGVAVIVPTSILMAPLGAWLAQRTDAKRLRRIYALFLLATAIRMLGSVVI